MLTPTPSAARAAPINTHKGVHAEICGIWGPTLKIARLGPAVRGGAYCSGL